MKYQRPLQIAGGVIAILAGFLFLVVLFIPCDKVTEAVVQIMAQKGYEFRAARCVKAFPIGITSHKAEIADQRGPLCQAERLTLRLKILPLLTGRVAVSLHAAIGKGELTGEWSQGRARVLSFSAKALPLEAVPLFRTVAKGEIKGELQMQGSYREEKNAGSGELRLEVNKADLRGIRIGEIPLPDAGFEKVQGMVRFQGGKGVVESLTFQGDGLYMRLKGDVLPSTGEPTLALDLELMPKPEFLEQQRLVFALLTRYQTTPGHYLLPVRGTLSRPSIQ